RVLVVLFFFSSRRRHTRFSRDWSSDVCSSDLTVSGLVTLPLAAYALGRLADLAFPGPALLAAGSLLFLFDRNFTIYGGNAASTRSEERRVGKECRGRGGPDQDNKRHVQRRDER